MSNTNLTSFSLLFYVSNNKINRHIMGYKVKVLVNIWEVSL